MPPWELRVAVEDSNEDRDFRLAKNSKVVYIFRLA